VVGSGVAGLSVAFSSLRRGLRTIVLERGEPGGATSRVAAGMLAPTAEAARGEEALLELNLASAELYPGWCAELARSSGGRDPGLLRCGSLMVARDRDEAEALERELEVRLALGLRAERLRPSEARRREPALAPTLRLALDVPDDHAIDPRRLTRALAEAIARSDGHVRAHAEVRGLLVRGERVEGVELGDGQELLADRVVLAAGPWSGELTGLPAAAGVPVRPVKGQILRLRDPAGPGLLGRVLRMEDGYLVPRGDGRYVLGATVEEQGWSTEMTAGGVFELLRAAREILPGVEEWVLEEAQAGLRPGTPDNAPVLGRGALENLFWATGHYRNGVLLAPITGEILAAALLGEELPRAARGLGPERFARLPAGVAA